ncbi:nitrate reductase associated protein [Lyngbya aestuarii]|uniref:nitrate reductase associated protein n=1 Tax=Lyngbya aestuarii TaxID=118322 RepID=UPI00403E1E44
MTNFFQFEADFVDSLRCIPMQVRFKLDTCGIKLKLHQWHKFNPEEHQALVLMPCITEAQVQAYREFLRCLVEKNTGETATDLAVETNPAWMLPDTIPDSVQEKTKEVGATLSPEQWAALTPLQRFALIKLSRSSHENKNFLPALQEFA